MKILNGTCHNITTTLLGRVESVRQDKHGCSHLLATCNAETPYVLLRSGFPTQGSFIHPSLMVPVPIVFSVGDILRITDTGQCLRLYEKNAPDNSLFMTDACNNRCLMCPQPPQDVGDSYLAELLQLIQLIEPSPSVLGITGGEPTILFDDLLSVVKSIRAIHPSCYLQLLTNGRAFANFFKVKSFHALAGDKTTFCIPLYADHPSIHDTIVQVNGAFEETLAGITNLGCFQADIEIRTVITKDNYRRLPQWAEFIYDNMPFVSHVAIMGMEPLGMAHANLGKLWILPREYEAELIAAVTALHRRGISVSIYNHAFCMIPPQLWPFVRNAISGWKVRYLDACRSCQMRRDCGGIFFSALKLVGGDIQPIHTIKEGNYGP